VEEVWEAAFGLQKEQWNLWDGIYDSGDYRELGSAAEETKTAKTEREKNRKNQINTKEDLIFFPVYELPGRTELNWRVGMGPVDIDFSEGVSFVPTRGMLSSASRRLTLLFY
jgi:hypothetical protein